MQNITITLSRQDWGELLDAIECAMMEYEDCIDYFDAKGDTETVESYEKSINRLDTIDSIIRAEKRRTI